MSVGTPDFPPAQHVLDVVSEAAKNGHPIAQSNLADLFFTQGNKEKAIFWAKKAYRNGAKLPDELKILVNIN